MPTLEERVTALETAVRNNELTEREHYNALRHEIADLGGLCAKSFLGVHHQLDRMEARADKMETRADRMEAWADVIDGRLSSLESDMAVVLTILTTHFGGDQKKAT